MTCIYCRERPACRFTECRKSGGCENSDRWCERPADPGDKYDPRHGLAQARPVTREQAEGLMFFYTKFNYKLFGKNKPLEGFIARLRELGIDVEGR